MTRDLSQRLSKYGASVIKLSSILPSGPETSNIRTQVSKSATSVGANYMESQIAASRADFINKLHIAAKELLETIFWLQVIEQVFIDDPEVNSRLESILDESEELRKIIVSCILTAKGRKK
jgi:four helix bundle protein